MQKYKIELKWAIIYIIMMLVWMTMEKLFGLHGEHIDKHPIYTNLVAIPSILIYLLALHDKKKNFYNGSITWFEGFIAGVMISFIIAVITPFSQYITLTVITPDYFDNAINYGANELGKSREDLEAYFNTKAYMMMAPVMAFGMGVITSAVLALATMNRPKSLAESLFSSKSKEE